MFRVTLYELVTHSSFQLLPCWQGPRHKMWPVVSARWGSYFVDGVTGLEGEGETQVHTWCSNNINTYSTIAIPSLQAIAGKREKN